MRDKAALWYDVGAVFITSWQDLDAAVEALLDVLKKHGFERRN